MHGRYGHIETHSPDGHRGSAKEHVKLQSEMDRAIKQVTAYNATRSCQHIVVLSA